MYFEWAETLATKAINAQPINTNHAKKSADDANLNHYIKLATVITALQKAIFSHYIITHNICKYCHYGWLRQRVLKTYIYIYFPLNYWQVHSKRKMSQSFCSISSHVSSHLSVSASVDGMKYTASFFSVKSSSSSSADTLEWRETPLNVSASDKRAEKSGSGDRHFLPVALNSSSSGSSSRLNSSSSVMNETWTLTTSNTGRLRRTANHHNEHCWHLEKLINGVPTYWRTHACIYCRKNYWFQITPLHLPPKNLSQIVWEIWRKSKR